MGILGLRRLSGRFSVSVGQESSNPCLEERLLVRSVPCEGRRSGLSLLDLFGTLACYLLVVDKLGFFDVDASESPYGLLDALDDLERDKLVVPLSHLDKKSDWQSLDRQ